MAFRKLVQLTGSSTQTQPCDNAMSMVMSNLFKLGNNMDSSAVFIK